MYVVLHNQSVTKFGCRCVCAGNRIFQAKGIEALKEIGRDVNIISLDKKLLDPMHLHLHPDVAQAKGTKLPDR